jgi:3-hydroxyisobutyrate dehydrogenase
MKIGFIGLGRMGGHMARNVLKSGAHEMRVSDTNSDAMDALVADGATAAVSPMDASAGADIVFTSLPGPADVLEVTLGEGGILAGLPDGATYVDLSTVSPETLQRVSQAASGRGIGVLDCPVSGGVAGAEAATLCLMAGGDSAVFENVRPVLNLIGDPKKVILCGDIGAGSVCKLMNNLVGLSTSILLAEAFSTGLAAGVDARTLYQVIMGSTGASVCLSQWENSILAGDFEPGFALALAAKDIRLATDLGRMHGIPMEVSNLSDQKFTEAMASGLGEEVASSVARLQEKRTGIQLRFTA